MVKWRLAVAGHRDSPWPGPRARFFPVLHNATKALLTLHSRLDGQVVSMPGCRGRAAPWGRKGWLTGTMFVTVALKLL